MMWYIFEEIETYVKILEVATLICNKVCVIQAFDFTSMLCRANTHSTTTRKECTIFMPENFKGLTSYRGFYRLSACPCIYRFTSRLLECQQKCIKRKN